MKSNFNLKYLLGLVLILCLINFAASSIFERFDFTEDQRYTLSETSLEITTKIKKPVVVQVFLKGDLPSEFSRLQRETRYILEEFAAYNSNIKFEFVNPVGEDEDAMEVGTRFYENGMSPENLNVREKGKTTETLIFPWATLKYGDKTAKVKLLQKTLDKKNEETIKKSIQNLEYAFADAFTKLTRERNKKIAIIKGQGELEDRYISDFLQTVKDYYLIAPFTLDSVDVAPQKTLDVLKTYDLIIDAKPRQKFSENKKYALDQYLMNGGKALWLTEHTIAEKDSLYNKSQQTFAIPNDLNLHEFFFKYGFRINPVLVNDLYSAPIVLASGRGNNTQLKRFPWFYEPLGVNADHPITGNIKQVKFDFANQIDTLKNEIDKTVLLKSSELSRKVGTPRTINLDIISQEPDPRLYTEGSYNLAVLLEGEFESAYKNKVKPFEIQNHRDKSEPTQQVVVADGDVIKNQIQSGEVLELGFDRYTGLTYGNKTFLLNTVNYLLGDQGLVEVRNKSIRLNKLDANKIQAQALRWQIINLGVSVLMLIGIGILLNYLKRKRYQVK